MKNVLILNYEYPPLGGGAASVTHEIAQWYVKKGLNVDVITMSYKDLPKQEIIDGINIFRVKCLRKKEETCETHEMFTYALSASMFLSKRLREKEYDFCHCHFLIPTGLVALFLKLRHQLQFIVTIHGSDIPGFNSDRFTFEHKFTKPLLKKIGTHAKAICSPSLYLKKLAIDKLGELNIKHIPNGIDLENFKIDFTRPKEKIILSTGRLLKRKGFQTLIRAVRDFKLPYEVHIVGDGPYCSELKAMAIGSKTKIIFHGWLEKNSSELLNLYNRASIFVLASSQENASIALLEGMAARCAMISTNVSGCPETLGDAGFLIDYDDDVKLGEILLELSRDEVKLKEYANRAYDRLLATYRWEKNIDKYLDVINS